MILIDKRANGVVHADQSPKARNDGEPNAKLQQSEYRFENYYQKFKTRPTAKRRSRAEITRVPTATATQDSATMIE